MHSRCEDGHSLPSLTTAQYMGTLKSLQSLFMGTLAPLSRLCAFTYTVPPLAGVHLRSTYTRAWCRADAEGVVYILSPAPIVRRAQDGGPQRGIPPNLA